MSRYRFALRPKWILSHLFVLALITAMVSAGLWQLRRLDQKRDRNDRIASRTVQPVEPVERLLAGAEADDVAGLEYRRVEATGTYLLDEQVLVRSRSLESAPGSWVVTPLVLDDGTIVVVNRGWISNSGQHESVPPSYDRPEGEVTVTGMVRRPETRGRIGPVDPAEGHLDNLARLDVARIAQQLDGEVLPGYVQLEDQDPPVTTADPTPVPREALDEGPHLNYAAQWFVFTTVAIVGYPLILRRRAREVEKEERLAALEASEATKAAASSGDELSTAAEEPAGASTDEST